MIQVLKKVTSITISSAKRLKCDIRIYHYGIERKVDIIL